MEDENIAALVFTKYSYMQHYFNSEINKKDDNPNNFRGKKVILP